MKETVSWDSSVGIATGYGLDGPEIESRWGARFFVPLQTGRGAHPASSTMGTGSFPGVKRPGRDVDHSPPCSKGKAVPLQAWSGPDGSRKLRFPDYTTTAQNGGKDVSSTHRPPLPPGNAPGIHFC